MGSGAGLLVTLAVQLSTSRESSAIRVKLGFVFGSGRQICQLHTGLPKSSVSVLFTTNLKTNAEASPVHPEAEFTRSISRCDSQGTRQIQQTILLTLAIGTIAFLYSSVGHGGASGYIAVMTLFGILPSDIKPTALILNILVSSIGTIQFWRAGHFSWQLFWPFALLAMPAAYAGGFVQLPIGVFNPLLGLVLLASAIRLFIIPVDPPDVKPPSLGIALGTGAGIGLLSGLTGTGGGVFLTPLILFRRWATTRQAAGVTALFILANSTSGLAGYLASGKPIPSIALWLAISAIVGGVAGSQLGSTRLSARLIHLFLAAALVFAGIKLILSR